MTPHNWRAIPYEESVKRKLHKDGLPYLWECRGCKTLFRSNSEDEPIGDILRINGVFEDCNVEVVSQVLRT